MANYSVQNGPSATYTYYADGSLKTIDWTSVTGSFQYSYTLNGQYGSLSFPNGQNRNYTYDDQGRLTQLANTLSSTNLGTFAYGYDVDNTTGQSTMLGQRTSMTSNGQTNYYYDTNYQLKQSDYPNVAPFNAEVNSWAYDSIGNRLTNTVNSSTQTYSYYKNGGNPLNGQRLQSDGTKTYTYDANGNIAGDGTYTNTWDYENRLTAVSGTGLTASYKYDYLGRRTQKTVNSVTTTYLYDGQNLIRESAASVSDYVFGRGIDEPVAVSNGGTVYYFNADGLGSIASLNDSSGTVQNSYVYDAWGVVRSQSVNVPEPFTYTARESAEAGLMYYRARYYNLGIGRFVSEDPIRGRPGLHSYSVNNPVKYADPLGLFESDGDHRSPSIPPDKMRRCAPAPRTAASSGYRSRLRLLPRGSNYLPEIQTAGAFARKLELLPGFIQSCMRW